MLELKHQTYRIAVADDATYSPASADNAHTYQHEYTLHGRHQEHTTSRHTIRITSDDREIASCILLAPGGPTHIHDNSAVLHDNCCIIAVGPFVASLSLPWLQLNWATETDDATCFGVYLSKAHKCLISHGELEIARVSFDGKLAWRSGGADIFTNGIALHGDSVRIVDFNDTEYSFDIATGRERLT